MAGLCVLSILTVWKMSTTPSYLILSRTILRVMKTPVLPTPALKRDTHTDQLFPAWWTFSTEEFRFAEEFIVQRRTCSAPWLVRPDRTAPLFCALGRWSRWNPLLIWAHPAQASRWTGTAAPSGTDRPTTQRISIRQIFFSFIFSLTDAPNLAHDLLSGFMQTMRLYNLRGANKQHQSHFFFFQMLNRKKLLFRRARFARIVHGLAILIDMTSTILVLEEKDAPFLNT